MCKCGERIAIEQPRDPYWRPYPTWWPYTYTTTYTTPNATPSWTYTTSGTTTYNSLVCTCPPDRGDNYMGTCPVHDTTVTVENFGFTQ